MPRSHQDFRDHSQSEDTRMDISPSLLAFGKLVLTFGVILVLLRRHVELWLTIVAGAAVVALTCGISVTDWPGLFFEVLQQQEFLIICLMVFLILMLSSVQEATGQSRLLVEGLEKHLHRPRIRLVLFPALIGLLPMPGGALFSCPMIKAASKDMAITEQKKAQINYWFRHIWELSWPLYPGYVLTCALLDIPLSRLCQFTFPLVPLAFFVGWFFLMRDLTPALLEGRSAGCPAAGNSQSDNSQPGGSCPDGPASAPERTPPLSEVLLHALPIVVTLAGAVFFTLFFNAFLPNVPSQLSFSLALLCAIVTALWQGRHRRERPLSSLIFTPNSRKIMVLLYVIFVFKHTIMISGLIQSLGNVGDSAVTVVLSFILLPLVGGLLTGLMVGFIGVTFPILIGILNHSPLQEYTVPLVILALAAGNVGQLLSPLHVCLVVTSEFFTTTVAGMLRTLLKPVLVLFTGGVIWALVALALGIKL